MSVVRSLAWAAGGLAVSPALEYAWHAWIAHAVGKKKRDLALVRTRAGSGDRR